MKKVLNTIWKFINSKIFGYVLILVLAVFFLGTCNRNKDLKEEAAIHGKNLAAMNDTIKTERLKSGALQVSIKGYVADIIDLENYNAKLAAEVKAHGGNVITLNRIVFTLEQENAALEKWKEDHPWREPEDPTPETDSTWKVPWVAAYTYDSVNYDLYAGDTYVGLRGPYDLSKVSVFHIDTDLTYRKSQVGLTWGQEWEGRGKNRQLKVFANTTHPAFEAKLLDGYHVKFEEEKHWLQGWGIGPTMNIGYDFLNNQPAFVVGIGIHYNLYKF